MNLSESHFHRIPCFNPVLIVARELSEVRRLWSKLIRAKESHRFSHRLRRHRPATTTSVSNSATNNNSNIEVPAIALGYGTSVNIDEDLHGRQLAVYGRETMRRLFCANILIYGMQGLGVEIDSLISAKPEDPDKYTSSIRKAADAQAWDNLELVIECLDRERSFDVSLSDLEQLSVDDPGPLHFVMAGSILRAEMLGIPILTGFRSPKKLADAVNKVLVTDFLPKKDMKIVTDEKATSLSTASIDDAAVIDDVIIKLGECSKKLPSGFRMTPIQFEKLPAIATLSALATGLVCIKLYKVLDGAHTVEGYQNTFVNLALPLFSVAVPVPPKVIKHQDIKWIVWDRWIITDNPTLGELLQWLQNKGLSAYSISYGSCLLYNSMFSRNRDQMDKKLVDLARDVAKAECLHTDNILIW
ncbi:Ubiquitin-activating enzyme E1, C-terminal [Dillenia turbinata]|uniref:Ubiquitin-activating enzyme E1, C-terminal n=1 Tax=Dillenia turbinata TaxID=194707 RepID=A0AAN8VZX6_9MAGN